MCCPCSLLINGLFTAPLLLFAQESGRQALSQASTQLQEAAQQRQEAAQHRSQLESIRAELQGEEGELLQLTAQAQVLLGGEGGGTEGVRYR